MKKAIAFVLSALCLSAYADRTVSVTNVVVDSKVASVQPFRMDVVTGGEDGSLRDRAGRLWSRLERVALENDITNMHWVVTTYTNALMSAMADLAAVTNTLPVGNGLLLSMRFPLDNTSDRKAFEGYVVNHVYYESQGYDALDIHFTKDCAEPNLSLRYVTEGSSVTNYVAGEFRCRDFLGSNWTNVTSVTWRDWTYDNVHRCYFRRPQGLTAMPIHVGAHLKWNLTSWGSAIVKADGDTTITAKVYDSVNQRYVEFRNGMLVGTGDVPWTYRPVSSGIRAEMNERKSRTPRNGTRVSPEARRKANRTRRTK